MRKFKVLSIIILAFVMLTASACAITVDDIDLTQTKTVFQEVNIVGNLDSLWNQVNEHTGMTLSDNDRVKVIIELEGTYLTEQFLKSDYNNIKEYIVAPEASALITSLVETQDTVKQLIEIEEIEIEYKHTYTALFNGFSAVVNYGDLEKLEGIQLVNRVIISEEYSAPETTTSYEQLNTMMRTSGIFENTTQYQGEGMLIAIVDTGLDYSHPAFTKELESVSMTFEDVEAFASSIYGSTLSAKNFTASNYYKSSKVPFQFDYADDDADSKPNPMSVNMYSNYHGTHVAGIAAGEDEVFKGVAPNAQLAALKVFSDTSSGAASVDIVAALSDSAIIGVDVINMSLGTPAGFTYERSEDLYFINEMYEKLYNLGISLMVSAGNSSSQSIMMQAGAQSAVNPDVGVLGSPSAYDTCFSVASIDSYYTAWFDYNDTTLSIRYAVSTDSTIHPFAQTLLNGSESRDLEVVVISDFGKEEAYEGIDVTGKAVVLSRGEISFEEKQRIAAENGAALCIIYNNVASEIINAQIADLRIPTCTMTLEDGTRLMVGVQNGDNVITLKASNQMYTMSDFSSWGCLSDLTLKPDMTAPGGSILSAAPLSYSQGSHITISGTSMAAPNLAGLNTVLKQYLKQTYPNLTNLELRTLSYQLMMSTATIAMDENGNPVSPRNQGAGVANINAAIDTDAYLSVTGSDRTKIELGDDKNRDGVYTLNFNIVNIGDNALSYNINAIVMTETVENGLVLQKAYVFNERTLDITVKNASFANGVVTVEAGETAAVRIVIKLSDNEKAYLNDNFQNGMYVEGYAMLESLDENADLSVPFLAFYGDWTDASIFDETIYSGNDPYIDSLYLVGNYNDNARMGDYQYVLPAGAEDPGADLNRIALSNSTSANYILKSVNLTNLRNATYLEYIITDQLTGYEYYRGIAYNVRKAYVVNGQGVRVQHGLNINANDFDWMNNQKLLLTINATLDFDGANTYQTLEFPIYIDSEKPTLVNAEIYEENGSTYLEAEIFDNNLLQEFFIGTTSDSGSFVGLSSYAIPVYECKANSNNIYTFDITNYMERLNNGTVVLAIDDSAYNTATYEIRQVAEDAEVNPDSLKVDFENNFTYTDEQGNVYTDMNVLVADNNNYTTDEETPDEHIFTIANGILVEYAGPGGEVIIPDGVIEIAGDVFRGNKTVTKITIPEGCITLGSYSFAFCTNLVEVVLPSTLEVIGERCFTVDLALEKINLQDTSVNNYMQYCFYGCTAIKELVIPDPGVAITMGYCAFNLLINCEKVTVNADIAAFRENFMLLINCKEMYFYGDIQCNITATAFMGLEALENLEFFGNVATLGNNTVNPVLFSDLPMLKTVKFHGNVEGLTSVVFSTCPNLEEIVFYGYLNNYNKAYVSGNSNKLTRFSVGEGNEYMIMDDATGVMYNADKTKMFTPSCWDYDGIFELPETVTSLTNCHFSHSSHMLNNYAYNYSISETGVGWSAAYGRVYYTQARPNLKGVKLHSGIDELPLYCFYDNTNMTAVEGLENITKLGNYTFSRCMSLETVELPNVTTMGTYTFHNTQNLKSFTMPAGVTSVPNYTFTNCYALESVELHDKIRSIGTFAFQRCNALKEIAIPASVTSIGNSAFNYCIALEKIDINSGLRTIGTYAFAGCSSLAEIVMPNTVTSFGLNCFAACESLSSVTLSSAITAIPNYAFYECKQLVDIELPAGVKTIGSYSFAYTGITVMNLPEELISFNTANSFFSCENLQALNVPENNPNVMSIDGVVFDKQVKTVLIYPIAKLGESYVLPETVEIITNHAFYLNKNIKTLTGSNVNTINDNAFEKTVIQEFVGDKLQYIGANAFIDSTIAIINLANVTEINENAFANALELKRIEMENVWYIGASAFQNSGLVEVKLPSTLEVLLSRAFADCASFETLEICSGVQAFDYSFVFMNTVVSSFIVGEDNETFMYSNYMLTDKIGSVIYAYTGTATELVLPEGVKKIAANAFLNNSTLEKVEFPSSLIVISDKAFFGNTALKELVFTGEAAPRLEGLANELYTYYYANFVCYFEDIQESNVQLTIYHPNNSSYMDFVWENYFAQRYVQTQEGYQLLTAKVSEVETMIASLDMSNVEGFEAAVEQARRAYENLTDSQKVNVGNYSKLVKSENKLSETVVAATGCNASADLSVGLIVTIAIILFAGIYLVMRKREETK